MGPPNSKEAKKKTKWNKSYYGVTVPVKPMIDVIIRALTKV